MLAFFFNGVDFVEEQLSVLLHLVQLLLELVVFVGLLPNVLLDL